MRLPIAGVRSCQTATQSQRPTRSAGSPIRVWLANRRVTGVSFWRAAPAVQKHRGAAQDGLPYRPWARELTNARQADNLKDSPDGQCLPLSILWLESHLFPSKIVQASGLVVVLYEKGVDYRQIFTDGRPLPVDPQPSFFGYSSGKWERDTLVVQTSGFRDDLWADLNGNPLTESAKITERFRRPNSGSLEIEVTVDDPKAYTAPWTVTIKQHLMVDTDLLEFMPGERERPGAKSPRSQTAGLVPAHWLRTAGSAGAAARRARDRFRRFDERGGQARPIVEAVRSSLLTYSMNR